MATLENEFFQLLKMIKYPVMLIIVLWVSHWLNYSQNFIYNAWGIYPREIDGLIGVFAAPLLHSGIQHLFSNSIPMLFLTSIMVVFYPRVAGPSFLFIYFLAGFMVWLFGRNVYHIGASGVVYGLVAFVFWIGLFRKNSRSIVLSLIIVVMYSGYIAGVLPDQPGISWESHLLGGLVGMLVAFIFKDVLEPEEMELLKEQEVIEEQRYFYLPRDSFDKTKKQRAEELLRRQNLERGGWTSDVS